jgi:hypothetical protein
MASRRNSRKASRKASRKNRKASRKNRKASRKSSRRNNMLGGAYNPMNLSLAQGQEFNEIHSRQHGGGAPLTGAPVGDQGLLPSELRDIARIGPLDGKLGEIVGMRDPDQVAPAAPQAGGGRRRGRKASRKNRKASRKNRKASRKNRKGSRKNRKGSRKSHKGSRRNRRNNMMGGAYPGDGSPLSSPNMLLSASQAAKAGTADFSNPWLRN